MGRIAGYNMAGRSEPSRHLPFFYSDRFGLSAMFLVGRPAPCWVCLRISISSRRRALTVTGMAFALCACVWLTLEMNTGPSGTLPLMTALALFGFGEGLFTSLNNSAVMASPPEKEIGQAGGLLNITRTSIGVTASAAVFS